MLDKKTPTYVSAYSAQRDMLVTKRKVVIQIVIWTVSQTVIEYAKFKFIKKIYDFFFLGGGVLDFFLSQNTYLHLAEHNLGNAAG
jgi:hypothetical protein